MLTGDVIWNALMNDEAYADMSDSVKAALRPFVYALPELLADLEDSPATLQNIFDAQSRFLKYCVDNKYSDRYVEALEKEYPGLLDFNELKRVLNNLTDMFEEMADDIPQQVETYLLIQCATEEEVMFSSRMGLTGKVLAQYFVGTLTIGDILRDQPKIIVNNMK